MTFLLLILILFSCGQTSTTVNDKEQGNTAALVQKTDHLKTGWYYLTDKENGIEKVLNGTTEAYYIDPKPIVTADNFTEMEVYHSNYGNYGLTIRLDDEGTEQWSIATGKSIGQKLALIIDNELYFMPTVNAQIDFGISALNRGDLTEEELKSIKNKIEKEQN